MSDIRMCTRCGAQSDVIDSRPRQLGFHRRRECPSCNRRWSTMEIAADEYKALVIIASIDSRLEHIADGIEAEANMLRSLRKTLKWVPPDDGRGD